MQMPMLKTKNQLHEIGFNKKIFNDTAVNTLETDRKTDCARIRFKSEKNFEVNVQYPVPFCNQLGVRPRLG